MGLSSLLELFVSCYRSCLSPTQGLFESHPGTGAVCVLLQEPFESHPGTGAVCVLLQELFKSVIFHATR